jgi:hypothetical protein
MAGKKTGAKPRHGTNVERDLALRVSKFVERVGVIRARERLHVSAETLDAAREHGMLRPITKARLAESLAREEAELEKAVAS